MLTIDTHRCPAELEWQKTHQENGEKAAHMQILPDESEMAGEMQRRSANCSTPAICPQDASGSKGRLARLGCSAGFRLGFNRWMQQIGEIVQRVFRSLVFSLGAHSISWQQY
jgi:hypothetical protein